MMDIRIVLGLLLIAVVLLFLFSRRTQEETPYMTTILKPVKFAF